MKDIGRYSILCVDENEDSCFMLSTLLGFSDINVVSANSVKAAFQLALDKKFDLYLLASRFPVGNGFELCRDLHVFSPQTPIVFYTGDAGQSDKQKGYAAGASAYLTKPDSDHVAETILNLIIPKRQPAKTPFFASSFGQAVHPFSNKRAAV